MGGSVLYIECTTEKKAIDDRKGDKVDPVSISHTGNMGDVMKESVQIAHSFVRNFVVREKLALIHNAEAVKLHLHVPSGATPKDGPSAGIAMASAMISALSGKPVLANAGMTGEISLTGKVWKIGGLKEKTVAARRANARTLIFPADNRGDWEELEAELREGITAHFVNTYDEVFPILFASKNQ